MCGLHNLGAGTGLHVVPQEGVGHKVVVAQLGSIVVKLLVRGSGQQVQVVNVGKGALVVGGCLQQILVVGGVVHIGHAVVVAPVQGGAGLVGAAVNVGMVYAGIHLQGQSVQRSGFHKDIAQQTVGASLVGVGEQ